MSGEMDGKTYRELLSTSMEAIPEYNKPSKNND